MNEAVTLFFKYRRVPCPLIATSKEIEDTLKNVGVVSWETPTLVVMVVGESGIDRANRIIANLAKPSVEFVVFLSDIEAKKIKLPPSLSANQLRTAPEESLRLMLPINPISPKYSVISKEMVSKLFGPIYDTSHVMEISYHDPAIVWMGAKRGDHIQIIRSSDTTGLAAIVRLVK